MKIFIDKGHILVILYQVERLKQKLAENIERSKNYDKKSF